MAGKLKPLDVERKMNAGKFADGDGLYLIVTGPGAKNWSFRYWFGGKERWHGLGSFKDVSLKEARLARDAAPSPYPSTKRFGSIQLICMAVNHIHKPTVESYGGGYAISRSAIKSALRPHGALRSRRTPAFCRACFTRTATSFGSQAHHHAPERLRHFSRCARSARKFWKGTRYSITYSD